jgi:hypothetical protein
MSGVYDQCVMWCPCCKKNTMHNTGWESSEPEMLEVQCTECHGPLSVSGNTRTGYGESRLVKSGTHTCSI